MRRFSILLSFVLALTVGRLWAEPVAYDFDYGASKIGFTYVFSGDSISGSFPDFSGSLLLDFAKAADSKVNVTLATGTVTGGFAFGTQALRGAKMLDVRRFPELTFVSKSAKLNGFRGSISGLVTMKGVTRPLTLKTQIFRPQGSSPGERDRLTLKITGRLNRHDFNVSGFPSLVKEMLDIEIIAKIDKRN